MCYYLESIEQFRISLNLTNITVLGHSFGGYLMASYSVRYQNNIKKVILVSPAGMTHKTEEELQQYTENLRA